MDTKVFYLMIVIIKGQGPSIPHIFVIACWLKTPSIAALFCYCDSQYNAARSASVPDYPDLLQQICLECQMCTSPFHMSLPIGPSFSLLPFSDLPWWYCNVSALQVQEASQYGALFSSSSLLLADRGVVASAKKIALSHNYPHTELIPRLRQAPLPLMCFGRMGWP